MAEKANDEVKNIPSELIAKLPTLPESLTEKKNRKEDLDKATLSQMSEAIEFPSPYLKMGFSDCDLSEPKIQEMGFSDFELKSLEDESESSESELESSEVELKYFEDARGVLNVRKEKLKYFEDAGDVLNVRKEDVSVPEIQVMELSYFVKMMSSDVQESGEDEFESKFKDVKLISSQGDDDEELDPLFCSGKVKSIKKLIESGRLPRQRILDEMCQTFGRKSKAIIVTCKAICEHIKSKHVAITHVWASYTIENPQRITFVITVEHKSEDDKCTKPVRLDKLIKYSYLKQYVGDVSLEGSEIIKQQTSASEKLDEESYQKLQSCISNHSEDLMKRHKYLSIISVCSNRSKGFGASWNLLPEKCIVLYVQTKNYIPIDEEPFETHYDGIPVDVREGAFIPFGRTAKDKLDPVKMGSQIGGENYEGTLGFFIDHPQFGICGLTCAHVLLTRWEMTQLKTIHGGTLKWPLHEMCKIVYQPADKQSVLGHTVQVIYKEGSDVNSGMELALFRITDRHPKSPSFPDETGSNVATSIKYDSWRMCSTDRLNKKEDNHVIKFGSKTEVRHGIIHFDTTSVKSLDAYPLFHEYAPIKLFKQIEVKSRSNDIPFAEEGDSGAPVFVVEKNSQNKCIGIIEGGTSYGTVIVTPIVPILAELDVPCLKSFDTEKELSNIQNKIDNIETQVQGIGSDMQTIKQLLLNHPLNLIHQ